LGDYALILLVKFGLAHFVYFMKHNLACSVIDAVAAPFLLPS